MKRWVQLVILVLAVTVLFKEVSLIGGREPTPAKPDRVEELFQSCRMAGKCRHFDLMTSLATCPPYGWSVEHDGSNCSTYDITIRSNGKKCWAWKGHSKSVFVIRKDRLYYVHFASFVPGGRVTCVDLKTGTEEWKTDVGQGNGFTHSGYLTEYSIDGDGRHVMVCSNETAGRFVAVIDAETGKLLVERKAESAAADK